MTDAYSKEMRKFDAERVLVAWDGLVAKQQAALENLWVPTMFVTSAKANREVRYTFIQSGINDLICLMRMQRQQRVVQVLEGIAGSDNA